MKERVWQKWVIDQFTEEGWSIKHCPTPMRPLGKGRWAPDPRGRGMLDLHMTHDDPPRMVIAECKATGGVVSDEQKEEIRRLRLVVETVREAMRPVPCPIGVYLFQPGCEALVEAIAKGKVMVAQ